MFTRIVARLPVISVPSAVIVTLKIGSSFAAAAARLSLAACLPVAVAE